MNSRETIERFLLTLSESFSGEVKPERLKIYISVLEKELADSNLSELFNSLLATCKFFPSVKEILDLAKPKAETPREKAETFVELIVAGLHASGNINDRVGEKNYSLWKKHTGIDRFAITSGAVDPRFMRGQWVDIFERLFKGEQAQQLEARKSSLTLIGSIKPEEPA